MRNGKAAEKPWGKDHPHNTNGLSDLIHGRKTAADLKGLVDIVSVSLNAGTEAEYLKVTRPKYGAAAYPAMQQFALDCKQYVPQVMFSVVDILPQPELDAAQPVADRRDSPAPSASLTMRRPDGKSESFRSSTMMENFSDMVLLFASGFRGCIILPILQTIAVPSQYTAEL